MGGRGESPVGAVVVAPCTSSSVGRVLGNRDVEGRRNYVPDTVISSSKITPKNRVLLNTKYTRRCSLVLSASSAASAFLLLVLVLLLLLLLLIASAAAAAAVAAAAAAAAAAATAIRTAGRSCSVFFFFSSNSLAKATW